MTGNVGITFHGNAKPLTTELQAAGAAVKQFGEQSEKFLQKGEISARQMAFALRGVPMQFTDIVTSLQAGQNPMTVFLQQGGQLKDMFGGAGIAAKAMGGYVMGLINPFSVAAAGAAVLGAAYYQGARESSAYTKAIVMSGNAMGTTSGQLKDMAQNVAASTGATVGAAAATLVQLASAGGISTDKLERITGLALAMEKQAGVAVADTVKQFSELGKDPVKASEKLSETTNFLTASIYNQIKALQDQGDAAGAAALAQTAAMDQMRVQNTELVQDLGYLETAFDYVWGAIKKAGDELKNFGRTESIAARIAELQQKVAYGPGMYGTTDFGAKARAQEQLTYLLHIQARENNLAASRKKNSEQRAAQQVLEAGYDKGLSKSAQLQKALAQEAANFAKVDQGIPGNVEKYHANMAAIQARYTETVKVARTARVGLSDAEKEAVAVQKALEKAYADGIKEIDASRDSQQKLMAASFEEVDKAQAAYDAHGKLASVITEETLVRLENARVITAMAGEDTAVLDAQIANRKRLIKILRDGEVRDASEKSANDMLAEQKRAAEASGKYWEDALMRAFESGKGFFQSLWDTIKNTLKTQVLKVMVQGTMGSLGLGAAGAAQAGTGMAGSALSSMTGGFLSTSAGQLTIAGSSIAAIGSSVMTGIQAGWAGTSLVGAQAAYTAAGMGGVSAGLGVGSSVGTALAAIPGIGWAALGVGAILALGNDKTPTRGTGEATLSYDASGNLTKSNLGSPNGGGLTQLANGVISGMSASYYATAKQLGITAAEATFGFGGNTGKDSKGANFSLWSSANGTSYSGGNNNSQSYTPEQLQLEASRAIFTALQSSTLPKHLQGAFDGLTASTATQAQIDNTIAAAAALSGFNRGLMAMPAHFQAIADLSFKATQGLIGFSGGMEALQTNLGTYYANFYSAEEQRVQTIKNINEATAGSGLDAATASKESFRDLVESWGTAAKLATKEGQKSYAALLSVAGAFYQVADAQAQAIATSVNTLFDALEKHLTDLQQSIAAERESVAAARAGMLGIAPKTSAQLAAEIAAAKVALPGDGAVLSALQVQSAAKAGLTAAQAAQASTSGTYGAALTTAQGGLASTIDYYKTLAARFQARAIDYAIHVNATGTNNDAYSYNASTNQLNGWNDTSDHTPSGRSYGHFLEDAQRFKNEQYGNGTVAALVGGNTALANAATAVANAQTAYNNAMSSATTTTATATAAQTAADAAAKTALLAYAGAMTQYSGDAEKAVKVLSQLREETVAYYEAQKELAGLMSTSAANLRAAVRNSQFGQLASGAALAQQQRDFASTYSLALATGGATKAGYADTLSAALPALTSALMDTSSTRSAWALATAKLYTQSETIAAQLDGAAAGMNFEAESLSLLGSIDVALGELDTNTAILKNAIDGGTATSAAGLRAIVTQLGGVPTFASGGYHTGGARIVGENGPELEIVGPSRIFNASQTRGLLQGGGTSNQDLVNELRALRQSNENMRAELRAIASATVKTAKILGRVTQDGESITTTVLA